MKQVIEIISKYFKKTKSIIQTDEFIALFTLLPLFFSWLPVLTWKYKSFHLRILSYYSLLNLIVFLTLLMLTNILSWIPFLGPYLSNGIHLIALLTYLGFSGFLIYLVTKQKNIEIPYISSTISWFNYYIEEDPKANAPIAQLDRASDYGSEGWRFKSFWAHIIH